ncbi:MAG: hypothetical protein HKL85_01930 [Acidimicrobiaceae bacterium]|nr:hypothetical protein [Acidimicrobiaceae bacterium]
MNTLNAKNDNFTEFNTHGTDRFLAVSVGTTPGSHSLFHGEGSQRSARRTRRSGVVRRHRRAQ